MIPEYWEKAKRHLRAVDPVMDGLIGRYEEPPLRSKMNLFETLVNAVVGQQISALAAAAVWQRVKDAVGLITPNNIREVEVDALRAAGLSGRKVEYVKGLAERGDWLNETPWSELSDDEVRRQLCTLRGIGPWTAEMALIFTFLRPDVLPLGDIGVVRTIERHYAAGERLSEEQLTAFAAPWQPFRTVGVWYLWRSLDPEPVEY